MISNNDYAIELDNLIYYFYLAEDHNIYLRKIKNKISSDDILLIEDSLNLISVILNFDKTVYLFVESHDKELILYEFSQGIITLKKPLAKGFTSSDYMKIVKENSSLHLFYAQRIDNCFNLYHCILTKELTFSSPLFIDKVFETDFDPFIINVSDTKLYISYVKISNYYYFMYRTYDLSRNIWSSNNILDSTSSSISDYDVLINNEDILYCYKTDSSSTASVYFGYGRDGNFIKNKLTEKGENILSPFLSIYDSKLMLTYYKPISKKLNTYLIISNFDEILDMDLSKFLSIKKVTFQSENKLLSNFTFLMQVQYDYILTNSNFFIDILSKTSGTTVSPNKDNIESSNKPFKKTFFMLQEKDQIISKQTTLIRELQQRLQRQEDNLNFSLSTSTPQIQELSKLQEKISMLSDKIKYKDLQLQKTEMLLDKNEKYIAELEERIETKDKSLDSYKCQIKNKNTLPQNDQVLDKSKEISNLLDEISKLKEELYQESLQINQLEDTISSKENKILSLEEELQQLHISLNTIAKKNSDLEKNTTQSFIKKFFSRN